MSVFHRLVAACAESSAKRACVYPATPRIWRGVRQTDRERGTQRAHLYLSLSLHPHIDLGGIRHRADASLFGVAQPNTDRACDIMPRPPGGCCPSSLGLSVSVSLSLCALLEAVPRMYRPSACPRRQRRSLQKGGCFNVGGLQNDTNASRALRRCALSPHCGLRAIDASALRMRTKKLALTSEE